MAIEAELRTECVSNPDIFLARHEEWNRFVAALAGHSCFHHHEWFSAAWAWRQQEGCLLRILFFYRDDALVGICPLILRKITYRSVPLWQLEFLTIPDTQFCTLLCGKQWLSTVSDSLATWLDLTRRDWTTMKLSYLPDTADSWQAVLSALQKAGFTATSESFGSNPYIDLTGSWEAYYKTRSRRLKKGNNLVANKLKKSGTTKIQWLRGAGHNDRNLQDLIDTLIELSASSWKRKTGVSLDQSGPRAFIQSLSHLANKNGWLSLWVLHLDEQPIAMEYQLIHDGTVYALRADFDEEHAHLSPGTYLNWQLLRSLFDQGFTRYYMGPGENAYKQRWMEKSQGLRQLTVYNKTSKGRLCALLFIRMLPMARNIKVIFGKFKKQKESS